MTEETESSPSRTTRRRFLALAAAAAAARAPRALLGASVAPPGAGPAAASLPPEKVAPAAPQTIAGTLSVDQATEIFTLPHNFTGLSYELAQLANPAFFSAANKALIALVRELSPSGVLRLGGGSSAFTTYSPKLPSGAPPFETFGPDTSKTAKKGTVTTELALRNLRAFLDAAGWSCLYGLNLGRGTKENAAAEAEAAHRILGPRLIALQIGNEPDSFRGRYRPRSYTPQDYIREWLEFHDAIRARVPSARFAGPDISNKLSYVTAFAAEAPKHPDIVLLTGHYYAMGPAGNPGATLDNLLSPDPKLTTLKWSNAPVIRAAMRAARLPFRVSEMNSCWNGGEAGVSDVFGSALWCADAMLRFASLGFCGVNLHGGGNGVYSPIVGSPSTGFARRPEFFGMLLGQHFAGATLLASTLTCDSDRVTAYAARESRGQQVDRKIGGDADPKIGGGVDRIAILNKAGAPAQIELAGTLGERRWHAARLTAPSVEAKTGIRFERAAEQAAHARLHLAPYSAVLLTARG